MINYFTLPEIHIMTESEIILVKRSWVMIRSVDPVIVGDLFYSKLFSDQPALRKMFPKEMNEQYTKLLNMINTIIARLDKIDEMTDEIAAMARRHVDYGVRPAHYKKVGKALIWTIKNGLGNDWTPELENAWNKCYNSLMNFMINVSELKST